MTVRRSKDDEEGHDPDDAIRHNSEMERREGQKGRNRLRRDGEGDRAPKKCVNYIWMDDYIFDLAVRDANILGKKMEAFISDIVTAAVTGESSVMDSSEHRLETLKGKARKHIESLRTIESLAIECSVHPSSDMASLLMDMCDEAGIDPDQVREKARNEPMAEAIADFRVNPKTKTFKCKQWMIKLMQDNNYRVDARAANSAAKKAGYTRDMILNVRNRLAVEAVALGDGTFVWVLNDARKTARAILNNGDDDWNG